MRNRPLSTPDQRIAITVDERASPEHLFRQLVAAYVGGASEFVVHEPGGLGAQTRSVVRTFTRRTIQPEIVSEGPTALALKDVSLGIAFAIPQLLHRMFQLVLALQQESGRSWETVVAPPQIPPSNRDDEVDRHAWLVERVLGLRLASGIPAGPDGLGPGDLLQSLLLARALERIGDHAVTIGECGAQLAEASLPRRVTLGLTAYHRQALDHLQRSFAVAERPDTEAANEVIDAAEALHTTHRTLVDGFLSRGAAAQLPAVTVVSLGLVLQSIDRTTAYAEDIAQVGLDRAASSRIGRVPVADPQRADPIHSSTMVEFGGKQTDERKSRKREQQ